jgi:Glycosyl transferase family 2
MSDPARVADPSSPRIAVLIPCYNEALTVATVVRDFASVLPQASIYVYDNNSSDGTIEAAKAAGAIVRREARQGKGHVVRRMFADIEADLYLMVDGDATYDAASAPKLIQTMLEGPCDMVNGARVDQSVKAYRLGHRFGNRLLTGLVARIFGQMTSDMLSGYKLFSRRFAKSFPAHARGFEIETELMVHALELRMPIGEVLTPYLERPEGSISKLSTFKDGARILSMIGLFAKEERPMQVFGAAALAFGLVSVVLAVPVLLDFFATGKVERFPTAILCSGLMVTAVLSLFSGLILDTVTRGRREMKRLAYLAVPALLADTAEPALTRRDLSDAVAGLGGIWARAITRDEHAGAQRADMRRRKSA